MLDANNNAIGTYFYDGEGKRVKKVTDAETTIYVFSAGKLVAEYSTAAPPATPTVNYTATDQLGSPRVLTNSLGEVVSRRDFLPFGEEIFADGQSRTTANKYCATGQDTVRKRFTGYEKDSETQLDFAEARMYENRFGRFTAIDPLLASGKSVSPQTFNRYVYCLNNPLLMTDPTGLQTGKWYTPVTPNGDADSSRAFKYIINGDSTSGYSEITRRNRAGDLIADYQGAPTPNWDGARPDSVLRFNIYGPRKPQQTIDVNSGRKGVEELSFYDRNGYERIISDDYNFNHPATGAVENAFEPGDVAFTLATAGTGKVLMEGGLATKTALTAEKSVIVTQKGLNIVESHLVQFGEDAGNAGMVERLRGAMANGGRVTGADRNFYLHELKESTLMGRGMGSEEAHHFAIKWANVNPFAIYHPEVAAKNPSIFSPGFVEYWRFHEPK